MGHYLTFLFDIWDGCIILACMHALSQTASQKWDRQGGLYCILAEYLAH